VTRFRCGGIFRDHFATAAESNDEIICSFRCYINRLLSYLLLHLFTSLRIGTVPFKGREGVL